MELAPNREVEGSVCTRVGCSLPATHSALLRVHPRSVVGLPGVRVCRFHVAGTTIRDLAWCFLHDKAWAEIATFCRVNGLKVGLRQDATLEWNEIGGKIEAVGAAGRVSKLEEAAS